MRRLGRTKKFELCLLHLQRSVGIPETRRFFQRAGEAAKQANSRPKIALDDSKRQLHQGHPTRNEAQSRCFFWNSVNIGLEQEPDGIERSEEVNVASERRNVSRLKEAMDLVPFPQGASDSGIIFGHINQSCRLDFTATFPSFNDQHTAHLHMINPLHVRSP